MSAFTEPRAKDEAPMWLWDQHDPRYPALVAERARLIARRYELWVESLAANPVPAGRTRSWHHG